MNTKNNYLFVFGHVSEIMSTITTSILYSIKLGVKINCEFVRNPKFNRHLAGNLTLNAK